MVHPLVPTTQIQIRDKEGPQRISLQAKKPFAKIRAITACDGPETKEANFIVFDRYRFEVVQVSLQQGQAGKIKRQRSNSRPRSRSLRRENSLTALGQPLPAKEKTGLEALQALRKSGKVVHCTFSESSQSLCLILTDKSIATFDFENEKLTQGLRAPKLVTEGAMKGEAWTQLEQIAGTLSNKLSKGNKLHTIITQEHQDSKSLSFELFIPVTNSKVEQSMQRVIDQSTGSGGQISLLYQSRQVGQALVKGQHSIQIVRPGALATSFVVNTEQKLNVSTEVRLERILGKKRSLELSLRCFVFMLESENTIAHRSPFLVKEERSLLSIQLGSKEDCQKIANAVRQGKALESVLKAQITTCPDSLVSFLAIESQASFHLLLVDVFKKQTVIDLNKRMHGDVPLFHTIAQQKAIDACWAKIGKSKSVLMLTMANGLPVCFDQDGQQVRLLSDALFGQNMIANFDHFQHRASLQLNAMRGNQWAVHTRCLLVFDGDSLQSFDSNFSESPFQKPQQLPGDLRRSRRIGQGFPLLTVSNDVVMDNKLFDKNERIFWYYFLSCKLYQIEKAACKVETEGKLHIYRAIFQGFNTVVYFVKYQEYVMALQSLQLLSHVIMNNHSLGCGETDHQGKAFRESRQEYASALVFKNEQIVEYRSAKEKQDSSMVDKTFLLRQMAACICCTLTVTFTERQSAISMKKESQNGRLLPEQIKYEQQILFKSLAIIKKICQCFFSGKTSFSLHALVAYCFDQISVAKDKISQSAPKALNELRRITLCREPSNVSSESGISKLIIQRLLQPSASSVQGADNFSKAVDLLKEHALRLPANEYLLALSLVRQTQIDLNQSLKRIRPQAASQTHRFRVNLPSVVGTMMRMKGNELFEISELDYASKVMSLTGKNAMIFGQGSLRESFDLYFADSLTLMQRALGQSTQSFDQHLLQVTFFNEVKDEGTSTTGEIFKKLTQLFITQQYKPQTATVALQYVLSKCPLVIEPESSAFRDILSSIMAQKKQKTTRYPKLLIYLLQNVNKMPIKTFKQVKLPSLALDPDRTDLNQFIFSSLAALCSTFKCDFSINTNALLNAPTITQGILESMSLEEQVSKTMLRTSKKIEAQGKQTDKAKAVIWEIVLWLWGVQCSFMASLKQSNRLMKDQAKSWRVRALAINKTLSRDQNVDMKRFVQLIAANVPRRNDHDYDNQSIPDSDSNDSYHQQNKTDLESVINVYVHQSDVLLKPLELVSRALTDQQFSNFVLKLPSVLQHFNAKQVRENSELQARVSLRIQELYWDRYVEFYDAFGLKMNYSVKYDRGVNVVQLIKRIEKKNFKLQQPNQDRQASIKEIEKLEIKLEPEVGPGTEDLLSKSMVSKESTITLAYQQQQSQQPLRSVAGITPELSAIDHLQSDSQIDNNALLDGFAKTQESPRQMTAQLFSQQQSVEEEKAQFQKTDFNALHKKGKLVANFEDMSIDEKETQLLPKKTHNAVFQEPQKLENDSYYQHSEQSEPIGSDFKQTGELNFLTRFGRVMSPLEPGTAQELIQQENLLDQSEANELQNLKYQISLAKNEKQQRAVKKSVRILERIFWRKQTQMKFGTLYTLRSNVLESKSAAERLAFQKQITTRSPSNKDDTTSIGQQTTTGALSTLPTEQHRGRGSRGGRGRGFYDASQRDGNMSPDFTADTRKSSPDAAAQTLSHTQRQDRHSSPQFLTSQRGGRSTMGRGGSSFSRADEEDNLSQGSPFKLAKQYKTITVREDDDFYIAYMNRGKRSPLGLIPDPQSQKGRFQNEFSSSRRMFGAPTISSRRDAVQSQYEDSRIHSNEPSILAGDEADSYIGWYDRRNRFLDLNLHVKDMQRRLVRTPEMEISRAQSYKKRSHSPMRGLYPGRDRRAEKLTSKRGSVLDRLKLFRVAHPSQWNVTGIAPMQNRADILQFPAKSHSRQKSEILHLGEPYDRTISQRKNLNQAKGNSAAQMAMLKQRRARFLHFQGHNTGQAFF